MISYLSVKITALFVSGLTITLQSATNTHEIAGLGHVNFHGVSVSFC